MPPPPGGEIDGNVGENGGENGGGCNCCGGFTVLR